MLGIYVKPAEHEYGIEATDFGTTSHLKTHYEGNQTAITHTEAREIVNKYFTELEEKMNAENIAKGKQFLEENKKNPKVVTLPSGLQYEKLLNRKVIRQSSLKQLTAYVVTMKVH
ncbi:MAG: FKBP-type peptidyl-prolyl cis-trans isomerase N-terminal domain-containing protein [Phocaeicola coprocola]